jgi:hypothetical protein
MKKMPGTYMRAMLLRIHVPPLDPKAVREALDRRGPRLVGVLLGAAQRLRMHEGEVGEVREVIDYQQVVRLVVHVVGLAAPGGIAQVGKIEDLRRVRLRRVAHPDPHQGVALDHRVAPHPELRRDVVLPGDLHAAAARVVLEAVVHAAQAVAFAPAVRELRAAMRAAVVERHRAAAVALVEHHRLLEERALEELAVDQLVVPGRDVPRVHEETLRLGSHAETFALC